MQRENLFLSSRPLISPFLQTVSNNQQHRSLNFGYIVRSCQTFFSRSQIVMTPSSMPSSGGADTTSRVPIRFRYGVDAQSSRVGMRAPSPRDRGIDDPDPVALSDAVVVVFPSRVVVEGGTSEGGRRVVESLGAHTGAQSTNGRPGNRPQFPVNAFSSRSSR